ncbi:MAG: alpha/beta hydrolase [Gemmatimonadota bacterium]
MQAPLGTFTFDGPAGRLEALFRPARQPAGGAPPRAAVVCHPLPTHGGTMHNKVVYRAAKALEALGYGVLRFNFRGVGASGGRFSDGVGEGDDVRAALDWLAGTLPEAELIVGGFSFGNAVGIPVGAEDPRVTHLVGLGTPTDRFPFDRLGAVTKPKLFVQGDRDEYGPLDALRAGLARVGEPHELLVIPGADHFFAGRLAELEAAIRSYFSAPGERSIASA